MARRWGASDFPSHRSCEDLRRSDDGPPPARTALATFVTFVVVGAVSLPGYVVGFPTRGVAIAVLLAGFALFAVGRAEPWSPGPEAAPDAGQRGVVRGAPGSVARRHARCAP